VNPDAIAAGLSGAPELGALAAGKLALGAQARYIGERVDFAIETTLAGRRWPRFLEALDTAGYRVSLYFLWVPDPLLCVARVRSRVMHGGHGVSEVEIRRRYYSGLANLEQMFMPRVHEWHVLKAEAATGSDLVARGGRRRPTLVFDPVAWASMRRAASSSPNPHNPRPRVGETLMRYADSGGEAKPMLEAVDLVNRALRRAKAVHKALGVPWAVWGANGVEWIAPEDLPELPQEERGCLPESSSPPPAPERPRRAQRSVSG